MFTLRDTEPAGERYGEGASGEARGRSGKKREGDDLGSGGVEKWESWRGGVRGGGADG